MEWVFPDFVKSTGGILKRVIKLHRQVAHDLIIDDLLLYVLCSAEISYSVT